ncbi:hypothetical protein OAQ99_00025 [Candidatus Kapabacteria bacterium]|nr:hypothetical protein [Candidatus Kapabacteria bacterium]
MKSRKIQLTYQPKVEPQKQKEKLTLINNSLIELRKSFLYHTNSDIKLKTKLLHFNKLVKSKTNDENRLNFISYYLFDDKLDHSK